MCIFCSVRLVAWIVTFLNSMADGFYSLFVCRRWCALFIVCLCECVHALTLPFSLLLARYVLARVIEYIHSICIHARTHTLTQSVSRGANTHCVTVKWKKNTIRDCYMKSRTSFSCQNQLKVDVLWRSVSTLTNAHSLTQERPQRVRHTKPQTN